jgi:antitoxin (DNA-binding transcriptional repressor) of toxin-antitoxin stability system
MSKKKAADSSQSMPSITLSQLRDSRRLIAWLRAGKTVLLFNRKTLIARIVPVTEPKVAPLKRARTAE